MISLPAGSRIWLVAGITDSRLADKPGRRTAPLARSTAD